MRRMMLGTFLIAALLISSSRTVAAGDDRTATGGAAAWRVGFGRADITPDRPVRMYGYASRVEPSEGVEGAIFVKAMALEDARGDRAVLVTTDLGSISGALTDPVREAVAGEAGVGRDRFLFTCSHNHSGPILRFGPEGGDAADDNVRYTRQVRERLIEAIRAAIADLGPARLSWGVGVAPFVMNRREFTPRGIILGRNPRGPADRSVPVLRVDAPGGKLRGVVFGCAAHNTTLTQRNRAITGDYAGFAQRAFEDQHPDAQAMFVTGFAGDANPYPKGTLELARSHGRTLADEVARVLATDLRPVAGPLRVASGAAELPFQRPSSRAKLEAMAAGPQQLPAANARALLERLDRGEELPTHQPAPVAVWRFGDGLTLVALSGEVVVDYAYLIEKALGPLDLWLAAYAHDVFGYVTSARVQAEGGYEAMGLRGKGFFAPEAQDAYVAKVRELAKAVGRDLPE